MLVVKTVEQKLAKILKKDLQALGFEKEISDKYLKVTTDFSEEITFKIVRIATDFGIIYNVYRSYFVIENVWKDLIEKYNLTDTTLTIRANRSRIVPSLDNSNGHIILKEGGFFLRANDIDNELNKFGRLFFEEYKNLILPFLKQTENINWIDKQINIEPIFHVERKFPLELYNPFNVMPSNGLLFKKIIVAKLSGNPRYENIYLEIKNHYEEYLQLNDDDEMVKYFTAFNEVYEKLKYIKMLKDPQLVK